MRSPATAPAPQRFLARRPWRGIAACLAAFATSCGGPVAGDEAGADVDVVASDARIDAADAVAPDGALTDTGLDANLDASLDANLDAGLDAATNDTGFTPPDGATPCSVQGRAGYCVDTTECTGAWSPTPGYCPGPANIQCCTPTPAAGSDAGAGDGWCPTNGFPTPNEGLTEEPGEGGCPPGMLRVDTFCIDRFEAALEVVHADGTTSSWSPYYHPTTGTTYRAVSLRNAVPQGYIDGISAGAACQQAGKRLCTDTEWLRACQGPNGYTYPYGNTRVWGECNDHRDVHPAAECFGTTDSWIYSNITYPGINQQPDTVDPTGARSGCVTTEGAFDMMGNLHEWTADPAGTFRGGYYVDTVLNGPGCLYATTAHNTQHWDYSTGFRCCADAP